MTTKRYNRPLALQSKEAWNAYARQWRAERIPKLRDEAFVLLGGAVCSGCGIDDQRVLCIDHINGGGKADRYRNGGNGSRRDQMQILNRVLRNPWMFRVLCHNCNVLAFRHGLNGLPPQSQLASDQSSLASDPQMSLLEAGA